MKRSEINRIIEDAKRFFSGMKWHLPSWAFDPVEDWKGAYEQRREIIDRMLGWDVTDFCGGEFKKRGLVLFTIRNGQPGVKPYCEKIMVVDVMQETPLHYHSNKTEDIINRGGGNLVMELYPSGEGGRLRQDAVEVGVDGTRRRVNAGSRLVLRPGESACMVPGLYHRFYGEGARVLVGEVSSVNDDISDNHFYQPLGRFPEIVEDEPPLHLLVSDYSDYI